jgi:phage regulator Rha-like protein
MQLIQYINGEWVTSSLLVAKYFNKEHTIILDKINTIRKDSDVSNVYYYHEVTDEHQNIIEYLITKTGFEMLAMALLSKDILKPKRMFLDAFLECDK